MLFITFHGGGSPGINTVYAYDDLGNLLCDDVAKGAPGDLFESLRGLGLVSPSRDVLWVASGGKSDSGILAFVGSGYDYAYKSTVAQFSSLSALWHPFDFTSDGDGNFYVSNQDTNVVARLQVASDYLSATAAPLAPALPAGGTFLPGTFVASSNGDLPGVTATTPVSLDAGLAVLLDCTPPQAPIACKVANSVRGVLWVNGLLYVADEVAPAVKLYDASGRYLTKSDAGDGPVHLVVNDGVLYTASGDHLMYADVDGAGAIDFQQVKGLDVKDLSGMAFGASSDLFVASRKGKTVYKYANFSPTSPPKQAVKTWSVPDEPEFLLYVPGPN